MKPTLTAAQRAEAVRAWFRRYTLQTRDSMPGGVQAFKLSWKDIPVLLELATSSTVVKAEGIPDGLLIFAGRFNISPTISMKMEAQVGMVALWFIEGLRDYMFKGGGESGEEVFLGNITISGPPSPICLKGNLPVEACATSETIHREALAAYREWWRSVQGLMATEGAKVDPLAETELHWIGSARKPGAGGKD